MVALIQLSLLVFLVALFDCITADSIGAVSTGCSDVCEYYEWGKDAKCQGRDLTYVPQECKSAKTLRMQDNRLQQLLRGSFSNFTCLKYLYLDRNNLTLQNGAFEGCDMVQQIHLNENQIPSLEQDMMKGLSNVLYMFMNKAGVKVIQPGAFQNMSQLQYLSLQDNELTMAPCDAFSSINSLHTLYLDSNKIAHLPDDCFRKFHRLAKLYLKNNPLGDVNVRAFIGLTNLIHLDMQYTNMTRVPTGIFPYANKIQTLHLSFNKIQYLYNRDFLSLSGLRKLYLQHNRIITIQRDSFEFLDSLSILDLSFNRIKSIENGALNHFPQLTDLRLQHNELNSTKNITFSNNDFLSLSGLRKLYLQHNRIITIQSDSFEFLDSLSILDLSFNRIISIENGALNHCPQLTDLRLQHNELNSTKNITFSNIPQDAELHLSGNPLHCDCSMYPLQYWLDGATGMSSESDPPVLPRCSTPEIFKRRLVTELSHHDICPPASGNIVDPDPANITPSLPFFTRGMPSSSIVLNSKMIGIITGVAVVIIFLIGGVIILIMNRRHDRRHQIYRHSQYESSHDEKKPTIFKSGSNAMNITHNPLDEGPALPPRPERLPNMGHGRRSVSSLGSQPPLLSNHSIIEVDPAGDATGDIGYVSPMTQTSRPVLSPQSSLSTSTAHDDGDYSEVGDLSCDEMEDVPSAADWVANNINHPVSPVPKCDQSPTTKKDTSYIQWKI